MSANQPVEYVLFDMDGLLLDSERVYTEVTNNILGRYGYKMTWEIKSQLMGKPEKESSELMFSLLPGLDKHISVDDYNLQRRGMQDESWPHVKLLPGAGKLIRHLHHHNIPMAVATGSMKRNFLMKVAHKDCEKEKVEVFQLFGDNIICGDDPRIARPKPAPDIFLAAATMIGRQVGLAEEGYGNVGVTDEEKKERRKGLVFEDGIPGAQAGLRAGMQVVWVPDPNLLNLETKLDITPISSLEQFKPEEYGLPPYDA